MKTTASGRAVNPTCALRFDPAKAREDDKLRAIAAQVSVHTDTGPATPPKASVIQVHTAEEKSTAFDYDSPDDEGRAAGKDDLKAAVRKGAPQLKAQSHAVYDGSAAEGPAGGKLAVMKDPKTKASSVSLAKPALAKPLARPLVSHSFEFSEEAGSDDDEDDGEAACALSLSVVDDSEQDDQNDGMVGRISAPAPARAQAATKVVSSGDSTLTSAQQQPGLAHKPVLKPTLPKRRVAGPPVGTSLMQYLLCDDDEDEDEEDLLEVPPTSSIAPSKGSAMVPREGVLANPGFETKPEDCKRGNEVNLWDMVKEDTPHLVELVRGTNDLFRQQERDQDKARDGPGKVLTGRRCSRQAALSAPIMRPMPAAVPLRPVGTDEKAEEGYQRECPSPKRRKTGSAEAKAVVVPVALAQHNVRDEAISKAAVPGLASAPSQAQLVLASAPIVASPIAPIPVPMGRRETPAAPVPVPILVAAPAPAAASVLKPVPRRRKGKEARADQEEVEIIEETEEETVVKANKTADSPCRIIQHNDTDTGMLQPEQEKESGTDDPSYAYVYEQDDTVPDWQDMNDAMERQAETDAMADLSAGAIAGSKSGQDLDIYVGLSTEAQAGACAGSASATSAAFDAARALWRNPPPFKGSPVPHTNPIEWVKKTFLGLEPQVDLLRKLLREDISSFEGQTAGGKTLLVHGPPRSGKSSAVRAVLESAGQIRVEIPCDEVTRTSHLFAVALTGFARGILAAAHKRAEDGCSQRACGVHPDTYPSSWGGKGSVGVTGLMRRLCNASTGIDGQPTDLTTLFCAAALARWGDDSQGTASIAFTAAVLHAIATAGHEGALHGKHIKKYIGEPRVTTLLDFVRELAWLASVIMDDLTGLPAPATSPNACGSSSAALSQTHKRCMLAQPGLTLVLEQAERLAARDPRMLLQLLRINELCGANNINLILVTHAPSAIHDVVRLRGFSPLIAVFWPKTPPAHVPDVLVRIMGPALEAPNGAAHLFTTFARRLVQAYGVTLGWDVPELTYLAGILWPVWWAAAIRYNVGSAPMDHIVLSKLTVPAFNIISHRLFDRDIPPLNVDAVLATSTGAGTGAGSTSQPRHFYMVRERDLAIELPWFTKFLLLASYIGSHNGPETDIRYLSRASTGKIRKRKGGAGGADGAGQATWDGPRPVPLERLLAIFHALVSMFDSIAQSRNIAHTDLFGGLQRLITMRLIVNSEQAHHGSAGVVESRDSTTLRFTSQASVRTVVTVARTVQVDLGRVLHNPA